MGSQTAAPTLRRQRNKTAAAMSSHSESTGSGATFGSMSALRVACRTFPGDLCDLIVLQEHVLVPRQLGHLRSLWWLGDEHHPRLAVTSLCAVEQQTGVDLGISPYCVSVTRWNKAARKESWLPLLPPSDASTAQRADVTAIPTTPQLESIPLPQYGSGSIDLELEAPGQRRAVSDRLRAGSYAVPRLFGGLRRLVVAGALATAVLACVYYLVGTSIWLWDLREGMTNAKIQDGVVLIFTALLFSAFTGLFRARVLAHQGLRVVPSRGAGRERQPLLYTVLDGYRLGVALQLLAFGAFVIF